MEQFDPFDPNYKTVEDMPPEQQDQHVNVSDSAFVEKSAIEFQEEAEHAAKTHNKNRPLSEKVFFQNSKNTMDVLQEDALGENKARESHTFPYQQDFREIFGHWPMIRPHTSRDRKGKVTYSDVQLMAPYEKFLNHLQEHYRANKDDRDAKILYGMEMLHFFTGHKIDPADFFQLERFTEYWKYKDRLSELNKSFYPN